MTNRLEGLIKRFRALQFVQMKAIYDYTGYSKTCVHYYINTRLDAPDHFVDKFEVLINVYEKAQEELSNLPAV